MVYPKDFVGNEILIYDFDKQTYSYDIDLNNKFYYPRKANGDEYYNSDIYPSYIEINPNEFKYAVTSYNVQIYAKDINHNEYYAKRNGKEYFAKNLTTNNEFYAKDSEDNEFYFSSFDDDSVFAKVGNSFQMYAKNGRNEFYPSFKNGKQLYAKHNFDEYYCKNEMEKEIYARNEAYIFYFAKNKWDEEIYARDSAYNEYYFDEQKIAKNAFGTLKYAKSAESNFLKSPPTTKKITYYKTDGNGNETYEENIDGTQIYKLDANKFPIYAKSNIGAEVYPLTKDKKPYFLNFNGFDIYAKDEFENEIYFDGDDLSVFAKYNNTPFYAKVFGKSYYPMNSNLEQFTNGDYTLNGHSTYPKDITGKSIYPKDSSQNEYYLFNTRYRDFSFGTYKIKNDLEVIIEFFYAKDFELNELYPPTYQIIYSHTGEPVYAIDKNKYIIYPKNSLNAEEYLWFNNGSYELITKYKVNKYADNSYPVFLPNVNENYSIERPLNNEYLKISGQYVYPVDEYANEYIPNGMDIIPELGYPITIDSLIIIPIENNKPKYFLNEIIEVKKLLYRTLTNSYDYLTEKTSNRKPRAIFNHKPNYVIKDLKSKKDNLIFKLIFLILPVVIAFLWLYFRKFFN